MAVLIHSALCDAMDSVIVQVESGYISGFAGLQLIGHTSEVCRNGVERARVALEQLGLSLPQKRIVVSLSPAELKKDGSQFDLAIAVSLALLVDEEKTLAVQVNQWLFVAELGLEGELRPVRNIVSFVLAAVTEGLKGVVVAHDNAREVAALAQLSGGRLKDIRVLAFRRLTEVLSWLETGVPSLRSSGAKHAGLPAAEQQCRAVERHPVADGPDFDDMILTSELKTVAMTVATGLHSLLLYGTPGGGKSMFSARLTSIFPRMEDSLHLDAMKIHSSTVQSLPSSLLKGRPPFRAPHHQASASALMGVPETPGEVSLAHGGILFLDEFPEFRRDIIESLREPLETGIVRVSRAKRKVTWKSAVTLIAACNLCPCGWFGSAKRACTCPTPKILAYRRRVSGPILDRIDVHVNMPEPPTEKSRFLLDLAAKKSEKSQTQAMAEQVLQARAFGCERNERFGVIFNRDLNAVDLLCASGLPPEEFRAQIDRTMPPLATSRSVIRALRVARTLADLDRHPSIRAVDLERAVGWQADTAARERGENALGGRG